jgi:hypothetical protein
MPGAAKPTFSSPGFFFHNTLFPNDIWSSFSFRKAIAKPNAVI